MKTKRTMHSIHPREIFEGSPEGLAGKGGQSVHEIQLISADTPRFEWCGDFNNKELNALHAEAFGHPILEDDWVGQVKAHSLGWATARDAGGLIGFINVAWDGGVHAFLLDTIVGARRVRQGIGTQLVAVAAAEARAAGCKWLHVDFEDGLRPFYLDACGFKPTAAGLMAL